MTVRKTQAFTLLELIVVIVILGILAGLAIPTFAGVIEKSRDETTLSTLLALDREAQALAAFEDRAATREDYVDAAADLTLATAGTFAASYQVAATPGESARKGVLGLKVDGDAAGISLWSPSGACVSVKNTRGKRQNAAHQLTGETCTGEFAFDEDTYTETAPMPETTPTPTPSVEAPYAPTLTYGPYSGVVESTGTLSLPGTVRPTNGILTHNFHDGTFLASFGRDGRTYLARMRTDGTVDPTFRNGTWSVEPLTGASTTHIMYQHVDANKNTLIMGYSSAGTTQSSFLRRYTSTGDLDVTFGTAGTLSWVNPQGGSTAMAVDRNNRIYLLSTPQGANATLTRLLPDGSPDTAYGTKDAGTLLVSSRLYHHQGHLYAINGGASANGVIRVTRFGLDGVRDGAYGTGGVVETSAQGFGSYGLISVPAFDQNNTLTLAYSGNTSVNSPSPRGNLVMKLTRQGTPVPGFGTNGVSVLAVPGALFHAAQVEKDGGVLVFDRSLQRIYRLTSDGQRDLAFGTSGSVSTGGSGSSGTFLPQSNGTTLLVAPQNDGSIRRTLLR